VIPLEDRETVPQPSVVGYITRDERSRLLARLNGDDDHLGYDDTDDEISVKAGRVRRLLATVDALEKEAHTAMMLLLQSNDVEQVEHGRRLADLLAEIGGKP